VLRHAAEIDILMMFHSNPITMVNGIIYKAINKKGFLFIQIDGGNDGSCVIRFNFITRNPLINGLKTMLMKWFHSSFVRAVDLIAVEAKRSYDNFQEAVIAGVKMSEKVRLLPNGFDMEKLAETKIEINDFSQKENLILTVGRIGSYQKNTEMLLKAAARLNLKDWKIALIGTIEKKEKDFQKYIDEFFETNPALRDKVVFTGNISDKKELWQWYNRAKVFAFPSRFESFGIVLSEALLFRNYIVSTDVGGAEDRLAYGYGELIPQEDDVYLAKVLQKIIDENTIEAFYKTVAWDKLDISWEKFVADAVADVFDKK
jgi:glycosyltransferase involved in cell wall biosynthesis